MYERIHGKESWVTLEMERERWDDKISEEKKEERDEMLVFGSLVCSLDHS